MTVLEYYRNPSSPMCDNPANAGDPKVDLLGYFTLKKGTTVTTIANQFGALIAGVSANADASTVNFALIDSDGHQAVDVISSALPAGAATEATLLAVAASVAAIDIDTDDIEVLLAATNALLTTVNASLLAIDIDTDDIETLLTAGNALLTTIDADTSTLAAVDFATQTTLAAVLVDTGQIEVLLTAIDADTSNIAAVDFATQTTLAAILVDTGQIETLLTAIDSDTSILSACVQASSVDVHGSTMTGSPYPSNPFAAAVKDPSGDLIAMQGDASGNTFVSELADNDYEVQTTVGVNGNGVGATLTFDRPMSKFCMQVLRTAGGNVSSIGLQGGIDMTVGSNIIAAADQGAGLTTFVVDKPCKAIRYNVVTIGAGNTFTINIMGMQ